MTDDDIELIHSPLTQTYSAEGHTLSIEIYRAAGEAWILEVVDELGTSTVWDEHFETDAAALAAAFEAFQEAGVHHFVTTAEQEAKAAEPALLHRLAEPAHAVELPGQAQLMMTPLSDDELGELDAFLLEQDNDEGMTLDMLDGFLHALAIGPQTVLPSRWLPQVWGRDDGAMLPPVDSVDEANHLLGLVMRHFNSIVRGFEQLPPVVAPCWSTAQFDDDRSFEDAEMWAFGFNEGVKLSLPAWQALMDDAQGRLLYRPIGLLGAEGFADDQDELTRTPEQREALTARIEESLLRIHAFWLPLRRAVAEREQARQLARKVGRNEPCPCGSGKKFKKCCGAPAELH